jgi:dipeptidyl aminopeptidase/acylaminoacyl peptidase
MIPGSGGSERQVTHEKTNFFGVTWSPDGQTLVFSSRLLGPAQLWQIPASGSGKPELIPVAGEDATFPRFGARPGGPARLVYEQHISDSNIWRVPVEISGAGPVRTKGEPMRVIASTRLDDSPQVSPDGRKVAFVSNRSGFDEVWTVGVDGTNTSVVTQMRTSSLGSPRWSADSSRLAFDAVSSAGRAVFLVDAAGGTPRQWTPWGTASRPSWSRDGRWLYYGEKDDKGRLNVWRASTVDQNQRQMWIPDAFEPFEAPDGTLYFERNDQIYRAAAGGSPASAVKLLIGLPTVHGWWGLGAGGIFFVDVISPPVYSVPPVSRGDKPVYFFDPRTGARRQIGIIGGDLVGYLPNFAVSPDGSSIYYSVLEVAVSQIRMIEGIW